MEVTVDDKTGRRGANPEDHAARVVTKFWIEYGGHKIELRPGTTLIGRSASCQVVLDDGLVSRRHAQLRVDKEACVLEDFGSVNGVFVNSERVSRERKLSDGDLVKMGKQELTLRATTVTVMDAAIRFAAETLHGDVTMQRGGRREIDSKAASLEAFSVLTNVAEKVLALGRGAEAERVLSSSLQSILASSKQGNLAVELAEEAAVFAVKLLEATRKPGFADYAFELYMNLRRPLPSAVVDQLYSVLRMVTGVDLTLLRNYLALLQAMQHSFGPADRFLVQRIEGLERLLTL